MFCKAKIGLSLATLVLMVMLVPAVNASPLQIITESGGFRFAGLGNNGNGTPSNELDVFIGDSASRANVIDSVGGSFIAVINSLTFVQGFTGFGSEGTYPISFSQLLTVNGQTQTLDILGSLTIGTFSDSISVLSSTPLLFRFDTFTVAVSVLPVSIFGLENGAYSDFLSARFVVTPNDGDPVPEPTTLLLLGTGLAGIAAKVRKRRKAKAGQA